MRRDIGLGLAGLCLLAALAGPALAQNPAPAQSAAGAQGSVPAAQGAAPATQGAAPAPPEECNSLCRVVRAFAPPPPPPAEPVAVTPATAAPAPARKPRRAVRPAPVAEPPARAASVSPRIRLLADSGDDGVVADLKTALAPAIEVEAATARKGVLENLLSQPNVDAAVVSNLGLERAKRQSEKLVYLAKLFPQELHAVVKSDIGNLENLRGTRVAVGPAESDGAVAAKAFLDSRSIAFEAVEQPFDEAMTALREGSVAALFVLAPKPYAPLAEIGAGDGLKLLALPPLAADAEFYPASLGHDLYPGLSGGAAKVETVALDTILVAPRWRESSPRQTALVAFARRLLDRLPALAADGGEAKWREVNAAAEVAGWRRLRVAEDWVKAKLKDVDRISTRAPAPSQRVGDIR